MATFTTPKLSKAHKQNFKTLLRAVGNQQVALMSCKRKSDGQPVAMICAVTFDGEEYEFVPFAEMVNGNPYELYDPPMEVDA